MASSGFIISKVLRAHISARYCRSVMCRLFIILFFLLAGCDTDQQLSLIFTLPYLFTFLNFRPTFRGGKKKGRLEIAAGPGQQQID